MHSQKPTVFTLFLCHGLGGLLALEIGSVLVLYNDVIRSSRNGACAIVAFMGSCGDGRAWFIVWCCTEWFLEAEA